MTGNGGGKRRQEKVTQESIEEIMKEGARTMREHPILGVQYLETLEENFDRQYFSDETIHSNLWCDELMTALGHLSAIQGEVHMYRFQYFDNPEVRERTEAIWDRIARYEDIILEDIGKCSCVCPGREDSTHHVSLQRLKKRFTDKD